MGVLLSLENDTMKISKYMIEARLMGINILNPDINNSELGFRLYNGQILYGIGSLTNLGLPKVEQIIKKRPYTSFEDFMNKNYHNIEESYNNRCRCSRRDHCIRFAYSRSCIRGSFDRY